MEENEIKQIIAEIESKLTGDAEQDMDIWLEYGERYRGKPGSEALLKEIARRVFELASDDDNELFEAIYEDMVATADEDYAEASRLIARHQYDEALSKLLVLCEVIRFYPLPEDTIWMDFDSYLDAAVYQDIYQEEIGEREIGRHPMRPGRVLFTTGSLLIEMGRPEEALEILERLVAYDPVCPRYLFELGEAYKRTGDFKQAVQNALWSLSCAHNNSELARGYRDLAYCLTEMGSFEDAAMLYFLSLHYESSLQAQAEIAWIRTKTGVSVDGFNFESIANRCRELGIPVEISETVRRNIDFLQMLSGDR